MDIQIFYRILHFAGGHGFAFADRGLRLCLSLPSQGWRAVAMAIHRRTARNGVGSEIIFRSAPARWVLLSHGNGALAVVQTAL